MFFTRWLGATGALSRRALRDPAGASTLPLLAEKRSRQKKNVQRKTGFFERKVWGLKTGLKQKVCGSRMILLSFRSRSGKAKPLSLLKSTPCGPSAVLPEGGRDGMQNQTTTVPAPQ